MSSNLIDISEAAQRLGVTIGLLDDGCLRKTKIGENIG